MSGLKDNCYKRLSPLQEANLTGTERNGEDFSELGDKTVFFFFGADCGGCQANDAQTRRKEHSCNCQKRMCRVESGGMYNVLYVQCTVLYGTICWVIFVLNLYCRDIFSPVCKDSHFFPQKCRDRDIRQYANISFSLTRRDF